MLILSRDKMTKPLQALIIGAGDRGRAWADNAKKAGGGIYVGAIAEPITEKRVEYVKRYGTESSYVLGKEALERGKGKFDAVIIATPDKTHKDLAIQALNLGYDVLLEKPMATNAEDCKAIVKAQENSGSILTIAHVLRYAPNPNMIKDIIKSKKLGYLTEIDITEKIEYSHFAHSYVRGNWRKESESSPIILAKSCHDLDLMTWFANSKAVRISSTGTLKYFTRKNAPEKAADNCLECKIEDCLFDATKFYIGDHIDIAEGRVTEWPYSIASTSSNTEERRDALRKGPYGKCVWKCDNDVMEHQDVSMEFENDIRGQFRLRSRGDEDTRYFNLQFTRGELYSNLRGDIELVEHTGLRKQGKKETIKMEDLGSHGGGDIALIKSFEELVRTKDTSKNKSSAELSLQSHLIAFAAERSRKSGGKICFNP